MKIKLDVESVRLDEACMILSEGEFSQRCGDSPQLEAASLTSNRIDVQVEIQAEKKKETGCCGVCEGD